MLLSLPQQASMYKGKYRSSNILLQLLLRPALLLQRLQRPRLSHLVSMVSVQ